jgi:hypothetical protein
MAILLTQSSFLVCGQDGDPRSSCIVRREFPGGVVLRQKLPPVRSAQSRQGESRYGRPYYWLLLNAGEPDEEKIYGIGERGEGAAGVALRLTDYLEDGKSTKTGSFSAPLRQPSYGWAAGVFVVGLAFSALAVSAVVRDLRRTRVLPARSTAPRS